MPIRLPRLPADPAAPFPSPALALREPDGLLAMGGDLSPVRLLNAYRHGIFPWFSDGQPILWWSPDPRVVFDTEAMALPRRLARQMRRDSWELRVDDDFDGVVADCATAPRPGQDGTWITDEMRSAYGELHRQGHAHCVAAWAGGRRVGGIYGVAVGRMFFGESMFSAVSGGSRVALAGLARVLNGRGMPLVDAQVENPHLMRLGARRMPREAFLAQVAALVAEEALPGRWNMPHFPAAELAPAPD